MGPFALSPTESAILQHNYTRAAGPGARQGIAPGAAQHSLRAIHRRAETWNGADRLPSPCSRRLQPTRSSWSGNMLPYEATTASRLTLAPSVAENASRTQPSRARHGIASGASRFWEGRRLLRRGGRDCRAPRPAPRSCGAPNRPRRLRHRPRATAARRCLRRTRWGSTRKSTLGTTPSRMSTASMSKTV